LAPQLHRFSATIGEETPMNLDELLDEAFLVANQANATRAIAEARDLIAREGHLDGVSYEIVVPAGADETWIKDKVLAPLVYFCASRGASPPACPGVFLSIFSGGHVYFVLAAEALAWMKERLALDDRELIARYGTGETEAPGR
jgi:hypothetical protein